MKKVFVANLLMGIIFFLIDAKVQFEIDHDLTSNTPLTEEQYLQKGGNSLDYALGYATLTSTCDLPRYDVRGSAADKEYLRQWPPQLREGSWARGIFISLPIILWIIGILIMYSSAEEASIKIATVMAAVATSILDVYLAYYAIVYIKNFWLL